MFLPRWVDEIKGDRNKLEWEIPGSQNPSNGMSDALVHCFAAKVKTEGNISDVDEISCKKWFSKQEYMELLDPSCKTRYFSC